MSDGTTTSLICSRVWMATGLSPPGNGQTFCSPIVEKWPIPIPVPARGEDFSPSPKYPRRFEGRGRRPAAEGGGAGWRAGGGGRRGRRSCVAGGRRPTAREAELAGSVRCRVTEGGGAGFWRRRAVGASGADARAVGRSVSALCGCAAPAPTGFGVGAERK